MVTEKITCECCGIVKGDTNHWIMYLTAFVDGKLTIRFLPWTGKYKAFNHLCGEGCAQKVLSNVTSGWSIPSDASDTHGT